MLWLPSSSPQGDAGQRKDSAGQLARRLLVGWVKVGGKGWALLALPYHVILGAKLGTGSTGSVVEDGARRRVSCG